MKLAIWLPNWPIQRLVVERPELRCQPVILFRRDARRGQLVAACSPVAERMGVRVDMPLSEAKSLIKNSAVELTVEAHNPAADRTALEKLAEGCDQFSPIVGLEQIDQPQTLLLDVNGLAHLFGGYQKLALDIARHFQRLGYYANICIADTTAATWGVTHFARYSHWDVAKPENANQPNKELGTKKTSTPLPCPIVLDQDDLFWQQLPVEALRIADTTVDTLHQLGIDYIQQLLQLPRTSLNARLGEQLLKRLDQISGAVDEPLVAHQPPPEFETFQLLEYATTHRKTIDFILWQKTQQLCQQLSQRQRGALRVVCRFHCESSEQPLIRIGLFQPTAVARHLIELIRMQLEQTALPSPVQQITLQVTLSAPLIQQQRQLFEQSIQNDWQALAQLVNRLSSRLGPESVLRPVLQSNAQPEHAVRYQKMTGQLSGKTLKQSVARRTRSQQQRTKKQVAKNATPLPCPFQRPLMLLPEPVKLATVSAAVAGDVSDRNGKNIQLANDTSQLSNTSQCSDASQPPAAFDYRRKIYQVARHWGPERIETGWWRGPMTLRDYYRIETTTGQRFWIFQNLQDDQWYLHGEF